MNYQLFLQTFKAKYRNTNFMLNSLREELQFLILEALYKNITFPLYFMGGTELRLSHRISRFSEDLDFALEKPNPSFDTMLVKSLLEEAFHPEHTGFKARVKCNANRNVIKYLIRFSGILFDLGLSPLKSQNFLIKLEIDIRPPAFARYKQDQYESLSGGGTYYVKIFDLSTGFAGKLGAIVERVYQKSRDYFDLLWYLKKTPKVPINMAYYNANAALMERPTVKDEKELFLFVEKKVKSVDLDLLKKDLAQFVMMSEGDFDTWISEYQKKTLDQLKSYQHTPVFPV